MLGFGLDSDRPDETEQLTADGGDDLGLVLSMGLELSVSEIKSMGWSPLIVFLLVTVFNTALALGVAWLIFGILFPVGV